MTSPKLILILSENWTLVPPKDLRSLVRMGVDAEDAGFDAVMVSEHVVLGPSSGAAGLPENPRDYALPDTPKPVRSEGPPLWFGGARLHDRLLRRLVDYGSGFNPLGRPTSDDLGRLRAAMAQAGRSMDELEMVGGTRGTFPDAGGLADLGEA